MILNGFNGWLLEVMMVVWVGGNAINMVFRCSSKGDWKRREESPKMHKTGSFWSCPLEWTHGHWSEPLLEARWLELTIAPLEPPKLGSVRSSGPLVARADPSRTLLAQANLHVRSRQPSQRAIHSSGASQNLARLSEPPIRSSGLTVILGVVLGAGKWWFGIWKRACWRPHFSGRPRKWCT